MRWLAYINRRVEGGIETYREQFDLPDTTRADRAAATVHAAKTYKVRQDAVLCVPCCQHECWDDHHDPECVERWEEKCETSFTSF